MNLEQEAREFAEARTKGIESHSTLTEQLVAFASKVLAEQNRDLIAERDGLRERVEMAKIAIDRAIYDLWGGGDNDRIERELRRVSSKLEEAETK